MQKPTLADDATKAIIQECREKLVELRRCEAVEAELRAQVAELKAGATIRDQRIELLNAAVIKYEAAIAKREEAAATVDLLRANHAAQMAVAERQLAVEKQKVSFWKAMATVGIVVGAVIGYAVGSK